MLDNDSTKDRLELIAKAEGISFEEGVLDTLIKTSDGDLRRAITYLQSASRLHGVDTEKSSAITPKSIIDVAGVVPDEVVRGLARAMGVPLRKGEDEDEEMARQNKKMSGFEQLQAQVRYVTREGYSTTQLLIQLHDYIMEHESLTAARKAKCAIDMGRADKDLTDGADEELQLLNLCLKMKQSLQ
jgi:replication factor C subunit 2/4